MNPDEFKTIRKFYKNNCQVACKTLNIDLASLKKTVEYAANCKKIQQTSERLKSSPETKIKTDGHELKGLCENLFMKYVEHNKEKTDWQNKIATNKDNLQYNL